VLFSEPKIPHIRHIDYCAKRHRFQCSSASRKFLTRGGLGKRRPRVSFQCSSASRKFLTQHDSTGYAALNSVSVLFSEPKIPHLRRRWRRGKRVARFSALQRAENSSPLLKTTDIGTWNGFSALQRAENSSPSCVKYGSNALPSFSALQRAENSSPGSSPERCRCRAQRFSALQRAENSSPTTPTAMRCSRLRFQCSSASRKFLTERRHRCGAVRSRFQCSSASRKFLTPTLREIRCRARLGCVSVLFSEPKIPHTAPRCSARPGHGFSALQRAENSSPSASVSISSGLLGFSALQRAENSSLTPFVKHN